METSNENRWMWPASLAASMLILVGVAVYLTLMRPQKNTISIVPANAPFDLLVDEVRAIPITGYAASSGYDHAFELLLKARGAQPSWWGTSFSSSSGHRENDAKARSRIVTVEKSGVRVLKTPLLLWTTNWNDELKCYTARLELDGSKFPKDKEVRWQGRIAVAESQNPPLSPTVRYDVLLKKAGVIWKTPIFSRDVGMLVRKVVLRIAQPSSLDGLYDVPQLEARITAFSVGGKFSSLDRGKYADAKGREIKLDLHDKKGWLVPLFGGTSGWSPKLDKYGHSASDNIREGILLWNLAQLSEVPRDLTIVARATAQDRWPLEFRFPIKRNGKILKGEVPVTMRPAPIERR